MSIVDWMKEWGDPLFYICYGRLRRERNSLWPIGEKRRGPAGNTAAVCRRLAEPAAAELGLDLWDVRFLKEGGVLDSARRYRQRGGVSIDDCVEMTRRLDPLLDRGRPHRPVLLLGGNLSGH